MVDKKVTVRRESPIYRCGSGQGVPDKTFTPDIPQVLGEFYSIVVDCS